MRRSILFFIALVFAAAGAVAQTGPTAVLEFFDDETQLSITDPDGFPVTGLYYGIELVPGSMIRTRKSYAEIRLVPNGSIIKLAHDTEFRIDGLQGRGSAVSNNFSLFTGKLRTVAATVLGTNYRVQTPTAVCGVRGTDFALEVIPGLKDAVYLREGRVEFTRSSGESIFVGAGEAADALAEVFSAIALTVEQLQSVFADLDFLALDPATVAGSAALPGEDTAEVDDVDSGDVAESDSEPESSSIPEPDAVVLAQPNDQGTETADGPETGEPAAPAGAGDGFVGRFLEFLRERVGMEMGSTTINGETWAKLVFSPVFTLGKFKVGLYLPILYRDNLFDPYTWFAPDGNNEWSFGTDSDHADFAARAKDFAIDFALKIRFFEYGEQRDPFFIKAGNLPSITLGHGILMSRYANDADFPTVRRLGLNLGLDSGTFGFESVVNDLSNPEIFGLRLFSRPAAPAFKAALGVSAVLDIDPAGDLPEDDPFAEADPIFLNAAIDLDIPIIEIDPFSIILFADAAAMMPYLRSAYLSPSGAKVDQGFALDAVYLDDAGTARLRNYGIMAGLFGNILMIDYRLDFRVFDGVFRPSFYGTAYDRQRGRYVGEILTYLTDASNPAYERSVMGIYGQAGFSLFGLLTMEAGYMWPWSFDESNSLAASDEDYLHLSLSIPRGVVPIVDLYGSVSYDRTMFAPTLISGKTVGGTKLSLFDENTVLKGEIVWGVLPTLDLVLNVSSTVVMESGAVRYGEDGKPLMAPAFGIETRLRF
jgi:hypothetical protein